MGSPTHRMSLRSCHQQTGEGAGREGEVEGKGREKGRRIMEKGRGEKKGKGAREMARMILERMKD